MTKDFGSISDYGWCIELYSTSYITSQQVNMHCLSFLIKYLMPR